MLMAMLARLVGDNPASDFLKLVQASAARKREAALRLRYYRDGQSEDLLNQIRLRWADPNDFRLFHVNVVKKVTNRRAVTYKVTPVRSFAGWDQAAGDGLYRGMAANIELKKASRLTKLCKTALLQVSWSGTGPRLSVITPNVLDVEHDGDPIAPTRIIVTHLPESGRAQDVTYSDWTAATYVRRDWRGNRITVPGNPDGVNPYGVLPFVPLFDYAPDDSFFLEGGADLIEAQRAINVALVNLWRSMELQSHGQAWASGLPVGDILRAGPDRTITLPTDGKFGFAAPNTPIADVLKAVEFLVKQTAVANDLAANVFELSPRSESAAAKLADGRDLIEARREDVDLWATYEARLFDVLKTVVNTHAPGTVPAAATIRVDFGEITEPLYELDRIASYERRVALGIWSPVDALMADNPDIRDREEAKRVLTERRAEMAAFAPERATVQVRE
jgi:hypothetical protein